MNSSDFESSKIKKFCEGRRPEALILILLSRNQTNSFPFLPSLLSVNWNTVLAYNSILYILQVSRDQEVDVEAEEDEWYGIEFNKKYILISNFK